jgi:hypothetical protein
VRDIERQLERTGRRRVPAMMAVAARYQPAKERMRIELASGAAFEVPMTRIPELAGATPAQLARVDIDSSGTRLRWRGVGAGVELLVARLASRVLGDASGAGSKS